MLLISFIKWLLLFVASLLWILVVGFTSLSFDKKAKRKDSEPAGNYALTLAIIVTILVAIVFYIDHLQDSIS